MCARFNSGCTGRKWQGRRSCRGCVHRGVSASARRVDPATRPVLRGEGGAGRRAPATGRTASRASDSAALQAGGQAKGPRRVQRETRPATQGTRRRHHPRHERRMEGTHTADDGSGAAWPPRSTPAPRVRSLARRRRRTISTICWLPCRRASKPSRFQHAVSSSSFVARARGSWRTPPIRKDSQGWIARLLRPGGSGTAEAEYSLRMGWYLLLRLRGPAPVNPIMCCTPMSRLLWQFPGHL